MTSGSINVSGSILVLQDFMLPIRKKKKKKNLRMSPDASILGLQVPGDKILGLAKFFLGIGIPGNSKDFFNQIDSLACLESNRQVLAWKALIVYYFLPFLHIIFI